MKDHKLKHLQHTCRRTIAMLWLLLISTTAASAITPETIRWGNNQPTDSALIEQILINAEKEMPSGSAQQYVPMMATLFLDTPYTAGTLEHDGAEQLSIDLQHLDCTTFVETVAALSITAARHQKTAYDFANNLERIRYRNGRIDGYASRLHYISDWILDNHARGILTEVTTNFPDTRHEVRTLDFISTHRSLYPAIASDDRTYQEIRTAEEAYRSHRYPYISKNKLLSDRNTLRLLKEGDIVAITTSTKGLDVSHIGIITLVNGVPHLLHASSKAAKVTVSDIPIGEYLRRNRSATGLRVIRLND